MTRRMLAAALGGLALAGCAVQRPVVPVIGPAAQVAHLAGTWWGEYWSRDSGRRGEIYFRLAEGADSAIVDVLMIPAGSEHDHPGGMHPDSEYLDLLDVRVVGNEVGGRLLPYRDPVCGCQVRTRFVGTLEGDRIEGTFTSQHIERRTEHEGRWRVQRVGSGSAP